MKYITILESDNNECPNVGTISIKNIEAKFKQAVESHFDAYLISFTFVDEQITELNDCINAMPIDCIVKLDCDGIESEYKVELSQTWLY